MTRLRWTKDGGRTWTYENGSLPYPLPVTATDTITVEPLRGGDDVGGMVRRTWQCVADRGHIPTIRPSPATDNSVCAETRKRYKLGGAPLAEIRLLYTGFYIDTSTSGGGLELPCGNDQIIDGAALEPISTGASVAVAPVLFDGAIGGVIPDGAAEYISDSIRPSSFGLVEFPPGWEFYVRDRKRVAAGQRFIRLGAFHSSAGEDTKISNGAAASQVLNSGALNTPFAGATQACCHGPVMIIGRAVGEHDWAFLNLGDSLADGFAAAYRNGGGNGSEGKAGWFVEGCWNTGGRTLPNAVFAGAGTTVIATIDKPTATTAFAKRAVLTKYFSHAVENYGTNDRGGGAQTAYGPQTADVTFERRQRLWNRLRNSPGSTIRDVTAVDILVRTASTDLWTTPEGQRPQTPAFGPDGDFRNRLNALLATSVSSDPAGQSGRCDRVFSLNASLSDGGWRWKTDGNSRRYTSDGTHYSDFGGSVAAAAWASLLETIAPPP